MGVSFGQSDGGPTGLKIGADGDQAGNARLEGPLDHGLAIRSKIRKVEMAVGVDYHVLNLQIRSPREEDLIQFKMKITTQR